MLYGWFYYPFRVEEEQTYRVVETAARVRYRQLGGTQQRPTFDRAIKELVRCGAIDSRDEERWDAARQLRNAASHPEHPTVMPPGQTLRTLTAVAHDINRLFTRGRPISPP